MYWRVFSTAVVMALIGVATPDTVSATRELHVLEKYRIRVESDFSTKSALVNAKYLKRVEFSPK